MGCRRNQLSSKTRAKARSNPPPWPGKSCGAWALQSAIVVSDGYHIYRVKKMMQFHGLKVYGSPRKERNPDFLRDRWNYLKQAMGYVLWRAGFGV